MDLLTLVPMENGCWNSLKMLYHSAKELWVVPCQLARRLDNVGLSKYDTTVYLYYYVTVFDCSYFYYSSPN